MTESRGFAAAPATEANAMMRAHQPRLAQHIRRTRRALGISAQTLARRMGYSPSHGWLLQIELGTRPLTLEIFRRIADALDVTPGQLWRGEASYLRMEVAEGEPEDPWGRNKPLWLRKVGC